MIKSIFIATFYLCNGVMPQEHSSLDSSIHQLPLLYKFNPDGYYFSKDSIRIKNYAFEWLSIFSQDNDSNSVIIRLVKPNGKWEELKAYKYKIELESSFFYFKHKLLGEIAIEGRFTGKNGPMEDAVKPKETIVFKGKVVIEGKSSPLEMTWWEGD